MVDGLQRRLVRTTGHRQVDWLGRLWSWYIALVVLMLSSGLSSSTGAAERTRPVRIGVLSESWGSTPREVGLREGLHELGYRERVDFVIGTRFTKGDITVLPSAARKLVQFGADLIFAESARAVKAAQGATTQLPIVFAGAIDPVKFGLVQSFARPGGNVTGIAELTLELGPKRLEVFSQLIPGLKRVLFIYDVTDAFADLEVEGYRDAAHRLGIKLVEKSVRAEEEAQAVLTQVWKGKVDGILSPRCCPWNIPGFILEAGAQQAIPTMFDGTFFVHQGALASYGPDLYTTGKQAARLVDKIIKGADPAKISVEMNSEIKFAINLRTAKALGLTIAPVVLFEANEVVR